MSTPTPVQNQQDLDRADGPPEQHDVGAMHVPIMREQLDPRDGYEPVPLWMVSLFGALVFWGGWYLATYSGGFRSDVLDEDPAARYAGLAPAAQQPVDPLVLGQRLYTANCVSCHQAKGTGQAGTYPPLAQSEWALGEPARVKRIVLHGLSGPVTVRGATYNGNMPSFAKLKDEQLSAIVSYVRGNGEWGNAAPAISAESFAATRAATADRKEPWTAAELMAIHRDELPAVPATQPAARQ